MKTKVRSTTIQQFVARSYNSFNHNFAAFSILNAFTRHSTIVKLLLAAGANKDAVNEDNQTPLYIAAKEGHTSIVKELLASNVNVNIHDDFGQTPLFMAVWNNRRTITALLLDAGADVCKRSHQDLSAIDVAMQDGNAQILHLFLNFGHKFVQNFVQN